MIELDEIYTLTDIYVIDFFYHVMSIIKLISPAVSVYNLEISSQKATFTIRINDRIKTLDALTFAENFTVSEQIGVTKVFYCLERVSTTL